ncbi:hypothetical protein C8D03_3044 [Bosea sp. 124]|nr:hypothetical protein C8D03_3044 [Bosea sp. 124]
MIAAKRCRFILLDMRGPVQIGTNCSGLDRRRRGGYPQRNSDAGASFKRWTSVPPNAPCWPLLDARRAESPIPNATPHRRHRTPPPPRGAECDAAFHPNIARCKRAKPREASCWKICSTRPGSWRPAAGARHGRMIVRSGPEDGFSPSLATIPQGAYDAAGSISQAGEIGGAALRRLLFALGPGGGGAGSVDRLAWRFQGHAKPSASVSPVAVGRLAERHAHRETGCCLPDFNRYAPKAR